MDVPKKKGEWDRMGQVKQNGVEWGWVWLGVTGQDRVGSSEVGSSWVGQNGIEWGWVWLDGVQCS